jgi:predicted ATPase with chaperone activity
MFLNCSCVIPKICLAFRDRQRRIEGDGDGCPGRDEARPVDVQVQIANGNVGFTLVGLGDKAVAESRERVRAALNASGLALPAKRITVNLAPADLPKEGSHYDLPIAVAIMAAIGAIPADAIQGFTILGELALDGAITEVVGFCLRRLPRIRAGTG